MPVITSGLMRLGRDAETRFLPGGQPIVTVSLAFNHGKKDDKQTQWVEAGFWGDYAAKAAPNMLKGLLIHAVLEDMHIEQFQKADGSPAFKMKARMQSFDYATPREQSGDGQQRQAAPAQRAPAAAPRQAPAPRPASGFDDMDDIPF